MPQFNPANDTLPNHGIPSAILEYHPAVFTQAQRCYYFESLFHAISALPDHRLVQAIAVDRQDRNAAIVPGKAIDPVLWAIKTEAEKVSAAVYRKASVFCFESGDKAIGWYDGNNDLFRAANTAALIIFGAERMLDIRNNADRNVLFSLKLANGSVVLGKDQLFSTCQTRMPKMKGVSDPSVCITLWS